MSSHKGQMYAALLDEARSNFAFALTCPVDASLKHVYGRDTVLAAVKDKARRTTQGMPWSELVRKYNKHNTGPTAHATGLGALVEHTYYSEALDSPTFPYISANNTQLNELVSEFAALPRSHAEEVLYGLALFWTGQTDAAAKILKDSGTGSVTGETRTSYEATLYRLREIYLSLATSSPAPAPPKGKISMTLEWTLARMYERPDAPTEQVVAFVRAHPRSLLNPAVQTRALEQARAHPSDAATAHTLNLLEERTVQAGSAFPRAGESSEAYDAFLNRVMRSWTALRFDRGLARDTLPLIQRALGYTFLSLRVFRYLAYLHTALGAYDEARANINMYTERFTKIISPSAAERQEYAAFCVFGAQVLGRCLGDSAGGLKLLEGVGIDELLQSYDDRSDGAMKQLHSEPNSMLPPSGNGATDNVPPASDGHPGILDDGVAENTPGVKTAAHTEGVPLNEGAADEPAVKGTAVNGEAGTKADNPPPTIPTTLIAALLTTRGALYASQITTPNRRDEFIEKALRDQLQAVALEPTDAVARFELGLTLAIARRIEEAIEVLVPKDVPESTPTAALSRVLRVKAWHLLVLLMSAQDKQSLGDALGVAEAALTDVQQPSEVDEDASVTLDALEDASDAAFLNHLVAFLITKNSLVEIVDGPERAVEDAAETLALVYALSGHSGKGGKSTNGQKGVNGSGSVTHTNGQATPVDGAPASRATTFDRSAALSKRKSIRSIFSTRSHLQVNAGAASSTLAVTAPPIPSSHVDAPTPFTDDKSSIAVPSKAPSIITPSKAPSIAPSKAASTVTVLTIQTSTSEPIEQAASNALLVRLWTHAASTYRRARRYKDAEEALDEARARARGSPELLARVYVAKAGLNKALGKTEKALEYIQLALALVDTSKGQLQDVELEATVLKAQMLQDRGDTPYIESLLSAVAETSGWDNPAVWYELGETLTPINRSKSIACLQWALRLARTQPIVPFTCI